MWYTTLNEQKEKKRVKKMDETKKVTMDIEMQKAFSYLEYHTDIKMRAIDHTDSTEFSFLRKITITNSTDQKYVDLTLKIHFDTDIVSMSDIFISKIGTDEKIKIRIPFIKVQLENLKKIFDETTCIVEFLLIENQSGEVIAKTERVFDILPISQLPQKIDSDVRLFAKLVTPYDKEVKEITLSASKILNRSLVAYQNKNKNDQMKELEAIYKAIHQLGINYQNPPTTTSAYQRIRTSEEMIHEKKGTCIDFAILYCSCLLEIGYHPILLIVDQHALAGVFLEDVKDPYNEFDHGKFINGIEKRRGFVSNLLQQSVLFMNVVHLHAFSNQSFQDVVDEGNNTYVKLYNGEQFIALDIATCQKGIFSPISTTCENDELKQYIEPLELNEKALDPIIETEYIPIHKEMEKNRFVFWEKKLLDLTEANPLVNFRMRINNTIHVLFDSNQMEKLQNKTKFKIAFDQRMELTHQFIEDYFEQAVDLPKTIKEELKNSAYVLAIGLETTLKNVLKKAKLAQDETGASTLYLCLGLLKYTKKKNEQKGYAPFMVLPLKTVTKERGTSIYTIEYDIDDLMINQTFFEYYQVNNPEVNYDYLYAAGIEDGYKNIVNTFKNNNIADIALDENCFFIANLTFSHYIMWQDMRKRRDELAKNKVVKSIIEGQNCLDEYPKYVHASIDEIEHYHDFAAPLPYDSTQLVSILECGEGHSFILDGPPGTGKSQTIVNMIVNAFYHGKTVLFVAEKKAALDVVASRLEKIGLGRFFLELHSNKTNKENFYQKLKDAMEKGMAVQPMELAKICNELEEKRATLLKVINAMHTNHQYYYSLYDAIVKEKQISEHKKLPYIQYDATYLTNYNQNLDEKILDAINAYVMKASTIPDFDHSLIKLLKIRSLNYTELEAVLQEHETVKKSFYSFWRSYQAFLEKNGFPALEDVTYISLTIRIFDLLFNHHLYLSSIPQFMIHKEDTLASELFDETVTINSFEKENQNNYQFEKLLDLDVDSLKEAMHKATHFFKKIAFKHRFKKALKTCILPTFKMKGKMIPTYLKEITTYQTLKKHIMENSETLSAMIGMNYLENFHNVEKIKNDYFDTRKYTNDVIELAQNGSLESPFTKLMELSTSIDDRIVFHSILEKYQKYLTDEQNCQEKYPIDYASLRKKSNALEQYLNYLDLVLERNHFNQLLTMASLNQIEDEFEKLGVQEIIHLIKEEKASVNDLKDIHELSVVRGCIREYFLTKEEINYFNQASFDHEIDYYQKCIDEYSNLIVAKVASNLTRELNHHDIKYKDSSPIGQLIKITSLKRGKPSIRSTLLKYDTLIKKYFPCFLMSPLSAAQYLSVEEGQNGVSKFDLVIFDEASQIPTHEAIGPIARGKSLIVAGDPLQMPPSNYFSTNIEMDEKDIAYDDASSLLDECLAIKLPRIRLKYHYRSRYEALIEFSNQNFYNDDLYTFPSPFVNQQAIFFQYVNVIEKKRDSSITKEELKAICDTFIDIYTNEETKTKSVGIIVFNVKQKDEVDNAISDILEQNPELEKSVMEAEKITQEEFFVKSIENVQGDERDIIILSINFPKSASSRPIVRGPIANANGERRLNVATSRSKERMIVISSIRSRDFEEDEKLTNKSKGALYLKRFLAFVESSCEMDVNKEKMDKDSILPFIKKDLEERGYLVDANVGNSSYKVDLAIKTKEDDTYKLGIIVDTAPIENEISCRDKMYLQNRVLENGLKWKIMNVYTIEYYKNKEATINQIIKQIETNRKVTPKGKMKPVIEYKPFPPFTYNCQKYQTVTNLSAVRYDPNFGFSNSLKSNIEKMIQVESPISYERIKDYVRKCCKDLTKISPKAESHLQSMLKSWKHITKEENDQGEAITFYWKEVPQEELEAFRLSDRDLNDIPKEEIICAMKQVLKIQGRLNNDDLYRATMDAFEYGDSILNMKNKKRLHYVYNYAQLHHLFEEKNN